MNEETKQALIELKDRLEQTLESYELTTDLAITIEGCINDIEIELENDE